MEITVKRMTRNIKPFLKYYKKPIIMLAILAVTILMIVKASEVTHRNVTARSQGFIESTMAVTTLKGKMHTQLSMRCFTVIRD